MTKLPNILASLLSATSVSYSILLLAYAIGNDSGHTGWNFLLTTSYLQSLVIAGGGALVLWERKASRHTLTCVAVGALGLLLAFLLHFTGTLMEYEAWLQAGQPL